MCACVVCVCLIAFLLQLLLLMSQKAGAGKTCHGLVNHVEFLEQVHGFVEHHLLTLPSSTPSPPPPPPSHTHREEECRKRVRQLKKQLVEVKREKEEELNVSLPTPLFHCLQAIVIPSFACGQELKKKKKTRNARRMLYHQLPVGEI